MQKTFTNIMACNPTGKKSSGEAKNVFKRAGRTACPFLIVAYILSFRKIVTCLPKFGTEWYFTDLLGS